MNTILLFLTSFFVLFSSVAHAQTPTPLTFPIAALGNCADKTACKTFCDDPVNQSACKTFAQTHGLTKPGDESTPSASILQKAASVLGCTSLDSCKVICSQSANHAKCSEFAKANNLPGGQKPIPSAGELLPIAKSLGLDVTSVAQLHADCDKQEYKEACTQLARKVGLNGGLRQPTAS